jgi:beta-glucanase (GH16 family)
MVVDPTQAVGGVVSFFWMQAGGTLNARSYGPAEFDIEFLLNESWLTSTSSGAVHYTTHPSGASYAQALPFNPSRGYHRYGFLWVPGSLSYTVDGQVVHTVTNSDVAVAPADGGWIMANVWTGNPNWGGGPPATPLTGVYNWIKLWPGATTVPAN